MLEMSLIALIVCSVLRSAPALCMAHATPTLTYECPAYSPMAGTCCRLQMVAVGEPYFLAIHSRLALDSLSSAFCEHCL